MKSTELHQKAETERETGNFLEALKLYEEVILGYQKKIDYPWGYVILVPVKCG